VSVGEDETKLKTKRRVVRLVSNAGENTRLLEAKIKQYGDHRAALESKWDDHRIPLEQEILQLEEECSTNKVDTEVMLKQIQIIRRRMKEAMLESKNKELAIQQTKSELESMNSKARREKYTRRILEIVASIHKQKIEISRIIQDNRDTQKLINQLRGRIDRTFAIADEVIFKDAKRNEDVRHAYKLLVGLHDSCMFLITTVEGTGAIVREIRELEQQIDKEKDKNSEENLEKIVRDYRQMKKENSGLLKQLKQQQQRS